MSKITHTTWSKTDCYDTPTSAEGDDGQTRQPLLDRPLLWIGAIAIVLGVSGHFGFSFEFGSEAGQSNNSAPSAPIYYNNSNGGG